MEERTRLGRGLEDVSQFFLSDHPREAPGRDKKPDAGERRRHIRVMAPGSASAKPSFIANFALELVRNRFSVVVWDGFEAEGLGTGSMLKDLMDPDLNPGAGTVRLYGLPDILVYDAALQPQGRLEELVDGPGDRLVLVNAPDTVESVADAPVPFDTVYITPVDEHSLLRCYASLKIMLRRDPLTKVYLVLDTPEVRADALDMFTRFAAFVKERLSGHVHLLGCLVRDDLFDRSMSEHRPLVLRHEPSAAREAFASMGRSFLESRQSVRARTAVGQ